MSNLSLPVDPSLVDVVHQYDGLNELPTWEEQEAAMRAAGAKDFPAEAEIPRVDWDDWIRDQEKYQSAPEHYSGRFSHQGDSHECVTHMSMQLAEITCNRQYGGLGHQVWFSPLALYTRLTGGRQWGGSNVRHALEVMMSEGMLPEHDGPGGDNDQHKRFKHTVHQTSGRSEGHWPTKGWIRESQFPDGWEETARCFRVLEAYIIPPDRIAFASAVLRWGAGNGRNGHSIPHVALVKSDRGEYMSKYKDSYDLFRFDSERLFSNGGWCIRAMTMPHDPAQPCPMRDAV